MLKLPFPPTLHKNILPTTVKHSPRWKDDAGRGWLSGQAQESGYICAAL